MATNREPGANSDLFADVPSAESSSEIDPHWLEMRGGQVLPTVYLPPSMAGTRSRWIRIVALALVAVFLGAAAIGVGLTYGYPQWSF